MGVKAGRISASIACNVILAVRHVKARPQWRLLRGLPCPARPNSAENSKLTAQQLLTLPASLPAEFLLRK
jgi:hypothetical protein